MNEISLTRLLDVAVCAAETAGKHALANKDRRTDAIKVLDHDIKLKLDVECQDIAEEVILSEFPNHGILGEEAQHPNDASTYEWIIDPIDGTMNFSHGFEYWCSSVAVRHQGKVVAGCVFAPEYNTCYTAHIEEGAKRNGELIEVTQTELLHRAMIFTGLANLSDSSNAPYFDLFRTLAGKTNKLRINGAAALDLCRVADGTCDGFFEAGIHLWDYAAAGLIAERAGAVLAIYPSPENPFGASVLASNPHLIEGLRSIYTKNL
jgi:myo-inositol-1(or 4)-monophosphatase